MANNKPINKDNPKNIYCAHCKHYKNSGSKRYGSPLMICLNPDSEHYQFGREYYNRCKAFEWEVEDGLG